MNRPMIIRPEDYIYLKHLEDIARKAKSREPISQYQKVIREINEKAKIQDN